MSGLYDKGREGFADGTINWTMDIRAVLVDLADYTVDLATHDFLADIPVAARIALSGSLTGKTQVAGVCDADDTTFFGVAGDQAEALALFVHTGSDATARLVAFIDQATGFAVTPNGNDIIVRWSNGANRIFKL